MIITFYSYKGGVGRSMALANVAKWFELKGLRVVLVDWDLEAPGLESYFTGDDATRASLRGKFGVVDLLKTYKATFPGLPKRVDADPNSFAKVLDDALPPLAHLLVPLSPTERGSGNGGLWLLPAGCREGDAFSGYAQTVQQFDWTGFYSQYEGEAYFEWLRRQLLDARTADVALIDSRTGVAEMSGVCTRHLADMVVMLCAPNDQNLEGVSRMAESFMRSDLIEARKGRPIRLVLTEARVDETVGKPLDLFEERFTALAGKYLPEEFQRVGTHFGRFRIPYIMEYSYSERLAVGDPAGVKRMQQAYESLALHLALLSPSGGALWRQCGDALQQAFGFPSVCIDEADARSDPRIGQLLTQLEGAGIRTLYRPLRSAIDSVLPELLSSKADVSMLLPLTPESASDAGLRGTWRQLRGYGIPVYFITMPGAGDTRSTLPRGLRTAVALDVQDADKLTVLLQSRTRPPRCPYLAPPPPVMLLGRERELTELKSRVLERNDRSVALIGLDGSGKSALIRSFCADDDVVDRFPDGILWHSMTTGTGMRDALVKWVIAFEGETATAPDPEEAERRLAEHLRVRQCLVAIDGINDAASVAQVPMGPNCRLLITARTREVALAVSAQIVEAGGLVPEAAMQLLVSLLPVAAYAREALAEVATALGGSPRAILAAGKVLRSNIAAGQQASVALSELAAALRNEGLDALGDAQQGDLSNIFSAAIELLPVEERRRLSQLVSLLPGKEMPVDSLSMAGVDLSAESLRRFANLSMIQLDVQARTVVVHPLMHAYLLSLKRREQRAQQTRLAGASQSSLKVYISYFRSDADAQAHRLYDRLSREFGPDAIVMDAVVLSVGEDLALAVDRLVGQSSVMLVLIGSSWSEQQQRLGDGRDFVRFEVERALSNGTPLVPVLINQTPMPPENLLPSELRPLIRRHALRLSDVQFNQDADRLVEAIREVSPRASRGRASATAPEELAAMRLERSRVIEAAASAPRSAAAPSSRFGRGPAIAASLVAVGVGASIGWHALRAPQSPANGEDPTVQNPTANTVSHQALDLFSKGESLYFGTKGASDYEGAFKLFSQAAELGYAPAENALGRMYESGQGTSRDTRAATQWYQRAAKQGHPDAQAALSRLKDDSTTQKQTSLVDQSAPHK